MSELSLTTVLLAVVALLCLIAGLSFRLHKCQTLFMFSICAAISGVINPVLFMHNHQMYTYEGWGAVRTFGFTFIDLLRSYEGFYLIFSIIVVLFLICIYVVKIGTVPSSLAARDVIRRYDKVSDSCGNFLVVSTLLMVAYFPLYEIGAGITGVPGELPFHLSGITHYTRAYLVPIVFAVLMYRATPSWSLVIIICIYAFVAGIAAASRFVAILPMVLAIFYFEASRKRLMAAVCLLFCFFLWFAVSASRDLTFDGSRHGLFEVIYYSLTNIHSEDIVNELDLFSGRLSGGQQMALVSNLHGNTECSNIIGFFSGMSDICAETAAFVFGLDLSGTSYGVGLALIPSIVIYGNGMLDYALPAMYVSLLLVFCQFAYNKLVVNFHWQAIGILYLLLSVLFLYLGQMRFFNILQLSTLAVLTYGHWDVRYLASTPLEAPKIIKDKFLNKINIG